MVECALLVNEVALQPITQAATAVPRPLAVPQQTVHVATYSAVRATVLTSAVSVRQLPIGHEFDGVVAHRLYHQVRCGAVRCGAVPSAVTAALLGSTAL